MDINKNSKSMCYLHPDFEDSSEKKLLVSTSNNQKKPSPLALLAETCNSICNNVNTNNANNIKVNKRRCSSETPLSPRSNHSSTSEMSSNPSISKRAKLNNHSITKLSTNVADNSTKIDTSSKPMDQSSILHCLNDLINPIDNMNNGNKSGEDYSSTDLDPITLLQKLSQQISNNYETKEINRNKSTTSDFNRKGHKNHITNHQNHYQQQPQRQSHFDRSELNQMQSVSSAASLSSSSSISSPTTPTSSPGNIPPLPSSFRMSSAIKYCMYCGQYIPFLPLLIAHISSEHNINSNNINNDPCLNSLFTQNSQFNLADLLWKLCGNTSTTSANTSLLNLFPQTASALPTSGPSIFSSPMSVSSSTVLEEISNKIYQMPSIYHHLLSSLMRDVFQFDSLSNTNQSRVSHPCLS